MKKPPRTAAFAEHFRSEILHGRGILGPSYATEELKRSRFFIETMEQFVASSEGKEVKALELEVKDLSPEAKDEFWQWHYPIHWRRRQDAGPGLANSPQAADFLDAVCLRTTS